MTIRAIIADDEPLAREGIRDFALEAPDVEIVAQCENGRQAVESILHHRPDLVLLDIQMPELDGFGVLEAIGARQLPALILVTAHDQHALKAFHAHAIDYLLKPVERERFHLALERARAQIRYRDATETNQRIEALLTDLRHRQQYPERVMVRSAGRIYFVRVEEIGWIEASGNYARLHADSGRHVIRETMATLERQLDPRRFVRIHRSTIVNLDRVREIQPWSGGDLVAILQDGTRLSLSRKYRQELETRMGGAR